MTWTRNAITGGWSLSSPSGREAVVFAQAWPGNAAVRLTLADPAHQVRVLLPCSKDARTAFEIGTDATHLFIRKTTNGTPGSPVSTGANDVPPSATATVTWVSAGLTAGTPFVLEVRFAGGSIDVRINGGSSPVLLWAGAGAEPGSVQRWFGFCSSVSGAVVTRAEVCTLIPDDPVALTEVLIAVCDGNVWMSLDGQAFEKIGTAKFNQSGPVDLIDYRGKVFGVDGAHAVIIDPNTRTCSAWTATAGTFPASTASVAGSTRNTIVDSYFDRVAQAGDPQDPQNAHYCAVADSANWDPSEDEAGKAYSLNAAPTGKVGQPITCLARMSNGAQLIGCRGSTWVMSGDPAIGVPNLVPKILNAGVSGKDAATLAADGVMVAHSPTEGLMIVPEAGVVSSLSSPILTQDITGNATTDRVLVLRDSRKQRIYVWITPTTGASRGFVYDERVGSYQAGTGGFFPIAVPEAQGPTCGVVYRGEVVYGGRTGQLWKFDDNATDDIGTPIESRVSLRILNTEKNDPEIVLREWALMLGNTSSSVEARVWGGRNAEEALIGADRWMFWSQTVSAYDDSWPMQAAAPALAMEIRATSGRWSFEGCVAQVESIGKTGVWSPESPTRRTIPTAPYTEPESSPPEEGPGPSDPIDDGGGLPPGP